MVLPAADNVCDCVTFGILRTFQRIHKYDGLLRGRAGGQWSLGEVVYSLLVARVKEKKQKKEIRSRDLPNSSLLCPYFFLPSVRR